MRKRIVLCFLTLFKLSYFDTQGLQAESLIHKIKMTLEEADVQPNTTYQIFISDQCYFHLKWLFKNQDDSIRSPVNCIFRVDSLHKEVQHAIQKEKIKNEQLFIAIALALSGSFIFACGYIHNRILLVKEKQQKKQIVQRAQLLQSQNQEILKKWKALQQKQDQLTYIENINRSSIKLFDQSIYPISEILYFEKRGAPVYYYTKDGIFHQPAYTSLIQLERNFVPMPPFLRIHRKYLINMYNIKQIDGNEVLMVNNTRLKIANKRRREVVQKIDSFFKNG